MILCVGIPFGYYLFKRKSKLKSSIPYMIRLKIGDQITTVARQSTYPFDLNTGYVYSVREPAIFEWTGKNGFTLPSTTLILIWMENKSVDHIDISPQLHAIDSVALFSTLKKLRQLIEKANWRKKKEFTFNEIKEEIRMASDSGQLLSYTFTNTWINNDGIKIILELKEIEKGKFIFNFNIRKDYHL